MNSSIKLLTDDELWNQTQKESETERNSTLKVIAFLEEIYSRRLHLRRGYSSLHEYCVSVLKYSDGGASRRIKAMLLSKDIPEVKKSIELGTLNLTTASQLQRVFEFKKKANKPFIREEKLDLFHKLEGQSKREVEKAIAVVCPEALVKSESQRYVSEGNIQKTFVITELLNDKIERLKKLKGKDFAVLLEELVDKELSRVDPMVQVVKKTPAPPEKLTNQTPGPTRIFSTNNIHSRSRYVPAGMRREVYKRCYGRCSYIDSKTGKKCESTHYLEIDHIIPFAKGGPTVSENLRLLCSNHNKLLARDQFGHFGPFGPPFGEEASP